MRDAGQSRIVKGFVWLNFRIVTTHEDGTIRLTAGIVTGVHLNSGVYVYATNIIETNVPVIAGPVAVARLPVVSGCLDARFCLARKVLVARAISIALATEFALPWVASPDTSHG